MQMVPDMQAPNFRGTEDGGGGSFGNEAREGSWVGLLGYLEVNCYIYLYGEVS